MTADEFGEALEDVEPFGRLLGDLVEGVGRVDQGHVDVGDEELRNGAREDDDLYVVARAQIEEQVAQLAHQPDVEDVHRRVVDRHGGDPRLDGDADRAIGGEVQDQVPFSANDS